MTVREFYELIDLIQKQAQIDYMQDLTKFAWLGQIINGLLGGKTDIYKEVTKQFDRLVASFTINEQEDTSIIEEWRELAKSKGLKYTTKKEVEK